MGEAPARLRRFITSHYPNGTGWPDELAKRVGVSRSALFYWLNGAREPDLANCGRLAEALGVKRWMVVRALDGDE